MVRTAILLIVAAVIAVAILVWSQQPRGPYVVSGMIESDEIRVGSRVGGRIAEVRAQEGQLVKKGDVLLRLEPFDLSERLAQADATLAGARADLALARAGPRKEEIEQSQALRDKAQAVLDRLTAGYRPLEIKNFEERVNDQAAVLATAQREFNRVQNLFEQKVATADEYAAQREALDAAKAQYASAEAQLALAREGTRKEELAEARAALAQAEANLAMLKAGSRPEEIAAAEAKVAADENAVAMIRRQIEELTIVAPGAATVEAVNLQPGDLVGAGSPVLSLLDAENIWLRAYVPENRAGLKLGQSLTLHLDAFPGRNFKGKLSFVARQAEFTPANAQTPTERAKQVLRIKVEIEEGRELLRPGMWGDVVLD